MITLSSDFGDPYPGAMKGVLLSRTDDRRLVDVSHDLPRGDVRASAFWLRELLPYFPPATHLVVVDPGVGTDRHAIVVRAGEHVLVGPDNGVLIPVARRLAGVPSSADDHDTDLEAYVIDEAGLEAPTPAGSASGGSGVDPDPGRSTFHGRDVFAPAAAAVAESDGALESIPWLTPLASPVDPRLTEATVDGGDARGEVVTVDDFGNVITNIPGSVLEDVSEIAVNGEPVPTGVTFSSVESGARVVLVGSHGYVELDVNDGRGDDTFGLEAGDPVVVEPTETGGQYR